MKRIEKSLPIGPLYAEQFRRNGIQSLNDLARATDLEDLSVRTQIPSDALLHWHQLAAQKIKIAQYRNRVILLLAFIVGIALTYEIRHWPSAPTLTAQGDRLYDDGDYATALDRYDKAVKANPQNPAAHAGKGAALRMLERCPEAQTELAQAIKLNPNFGWAYVESGACDDNAGDYSKALVNFNKAIELEPSNRFAHGLAGGALRRLGKYPEAMKELDKAIELDSSYVWAYNERAHLWSDQRRYTDALEDYERALSLNGDYKYAYAKAFPLLMLGRTQDALDATNAAVKLDSKWAWAHAQRGSIYHDYLFDFETAYQDLKIVSELGEHDEDLDLAEAALTTSRFQEAYDLAHKQIAASEKLDDPSVDVSNQCTARFIAIAALLMQNNTAQAKEELQEFITYFRAASPRLQHHWNYAGTQYFLTHPAMDPASLLKVDTGSQPTKDPESKALILALIHLLQDKPTANIDEIEALARQLK